MIGSRNRGLIVIGAVITVMIVIAIVSMVVVNVGPGGAPPTPTSSYTVAALRPGEDAILNSYGWVDQKNGIARIPIDRAIDIVAARGLPARPTSTATNDEGETIPSYSSSGTQPREWLH